MTLSEFRLIGLVLLAAQGASAAPLERGPMPHLVDRYGEPLPTGAILRIGSASKRAVYEDLSRLDNRAAISPDGRLLVGPQLEEGGRALEFWDVVTGRFFRSLHNIDWQPWDLAFSVDGWTLTASNSHRVYTWSATSGVERRRVEFNLPGVTSELFVHPSLSPDGRRVACAVSKYVDEPTELAVWDAATGFLAHRHRLPDGVLSSDCVWAPDSRMVLLAAEDGVVSVDTDTGRVGASFRAEWWPRPPAPQTPSILPTPPKFSPDGWLVAGWRYRERADAPDRLAVWEAASGRHVTTIDVADPTKVEFAFAARVRALVIRDGAFLRVVDLVSGKERGKWTLPQAVEKLWVLPGDLKALTAMRDGTGLVWDLTSFAPPPIFGRPVESDLLAWWDDLGRDDAAVAYKAACRLAEPPNIDAVRFLRERVRPARAIDSAEIRRLIDRLDDKAFGPREAAGVDLLRIGSAARPYLLAAHASLSAEAAETRKRLAEQLAGPAPSAETLRRLRAIAVLEWTASADANALLDELARGAADALETQAARLSIARMRKAFSPR